MANEEKELYKFVNDPKYRDKIIAKIHKDDDNAYNKRIKQIEHEKDILLKNKTKEITRIANSRWEKLAGGKIMVNRTEGKIQVNNLTALFSGIQGAELNMIVGSRIVTTENTKTKSKKHASLGGAVAGGLILGPVGAVAGGVGLGKTKGKTTGTTVSNQIPTCTHLGIMVNIDGFISEVVLISSQVDQASASFSKAQNDAQNIIAQLKILAKTPVPIQFIKPEEEASVKAIESQINNKQTELQKAMEDKPTYIIPGIYRTDEQREMSDEEYLQYLYNTDAQRMSEKAANEVAFKQEQAERKAAEKAKKVEEKTARQHQKNQDVVNADYIGTAKGIASVIYKVIFWALSIFILLFALVSFSNTGIVSGNLFLITAIAVNPLVEDIIRTKLFNLPKWVAIVILVIGFLAGVLTFPQTDSVTETTSSIELSEYDV